MKTKNFLRIVGILFIALLQAAVSIAAGASYSVPALSKAVVSPTLTVSIAKTNITCNGANNGNATATETNGAPPFTYSWSDGATSFSSSNTNATGSVLSPGTYTVTVTDNNGYSATKTANITEPNLLTTTASVITNACYLVNNGSASTTHSGGTTPYTYSWSNGATNSTTGATLSAGTYTITLTDNNGCTATSSITITQPTQDVSAGMPVITNACNSTSNGSATVSPTGGSTPYTYSWSPIGGTKASATGLSGGAYTVTVQDNCGNSASATATINESSTITPTTSVSTPITCNGGTGTITATSTGGAPPYTYSWNGGGGNASTTIPVITGTYTVTVTDANGCTATKKVTLTQPTALSVTTISIIGVPCYGGNTGKATANPHNGTSPYTYSWSNGIATSATGSVLVAGTYTVTLTDSCGASATATAIITQPNALTATTAQTAATCYGESQATASVTVPASSGTVPFTYSWSNGLGTNTTVSGLSAGTYTVTVTDKSTCGDIFTTNVVITQPNALAATASQTGITCYGQSQATASVTVTNGTGTSPYTYSWYPSGGNGSTASSLAEGTYTVTVTDSCGASVSPTVTITQSTILSATASQTGTTCYGESQATATASPSNGTSPYTYLWSDVSGQTTQSAIGLSAGTYTVIVTDSCGASVSPSVTITQPTAFSATASVTTNVRCNGGSTGSTTANPSNGTSPYTYSWSANTGGISILSPNWQTPIPAMGGQITQVASGLSAGTYTVIVTDNCGVSFSPTVVITQPTAFSATASATTNVRCNTGSDGSATASPLNGTTPYTYSWAPSGGNGSTANSLTAGTYTVTIRDNCGVSFSPIVAITQPAAFSATASVTANVRCNGVSTGSAMATASNGTSPYTYSWSPTGGNGSTANSLAAGTYTATVTDSCGVSFSPTVIITQPAAFSATASITANVSCNGLSNGVATASPLNGTTPYTYSWTPSGGNGSTANSLAAGTYTVTITDSCGISFSPTVTITQPDILSPNITPTNVTCNGGDNGNATANPTGGTSPYTYSWSSGSTTTSAIVPPTDTTFSYTGAIQSWTVPAGITTATITVTGAQGGESSVNYSGAGASFTGIYTVISTHTFAVVVGGQGTASTYGGGGGASFVYDATNSNALFAVAAGGGGGGADPNHNGYGGAGGINLTTNAPPSGTGVYASGGTGGNGGSAGTGTGGGAGGSGWLGNGGSSSPAIGGNDFTGGDGYSGATGGFGGGGGGGSTGGGGGAGYNGGGGGNNVTAIYGGGDGGGSYYNSAYGTAGTATATNTGNGSVIISYGVSVSASTYSLTVTDSNGCTVSTTVTITPPNALTSGGVTINSEVRCNGGNNGSATEAISGGTSPYTYLWSGSNTNNSFKDNTGTESSLPADTYTITVTDACSGDQTTATVTITQPDALVSNGVINIRGISCNGGNTGSATETISGGASPYTYVWSGSNTNNSFTDNTGTESSLPADTYTITVTDACPDNTATATVMITEPTALSAPTSVITPIVCYGATATASTSASGGTIPYTYSWSPSGGNGHKAGELSAGTYTVTVTDNNGCTIQESVTVTSPAQLTTTASQTQATCHGENTGAATASPSNGTSPYTYSWNGGRGINPTATGLGAGTYTITIKDNCGASVTASVTITQPDALTSAPSIISPVLCNGTATGSATAGAAGGTSPYTYSWSSGSTLASVISPPTVETFSYTGAIQHYTIPAGITQVTLSVTGAAGGNGSAAGGNGASFMGTCTVTPGDILSVVVGAQGYSQANWGGGGGGGSFVYDSAVVGYSPSGTTGLLAVAGGGGGGSSIDGNTGGAGGTNLAGNATTCGTGIDNDGDASGGTGGNGGNGGTGDGPGAAGAGWLSNGQNSQGTSNCGGGYDEEYGFTGGAGNLNGDNGGFGGGGGLGYNAGSGGGGYNGGGGGNDFLSSGGGGGGGSYLSGGITNLIGSVTATNTGNGSVVITLPQVTGVSAGTYSVSVTDNCGASATATVTITQPGALTSGEATVNNGVRCNGGNNGSATETISGGTSPYTYLWSGSNTNNSFIDYTGTESSLPADTYTITGTDANGCTTSDTVTITQPTAFSATASATTNVICNAGSDASATASPSNGTTPYTYLWSDANSQTTPIASGLGAGTYTVTVTDNCGVSYSPTVIIAQPNPLGITIAGSTQLVGCTAYGSITAYGATGGTSPYTYSWSPNGGTDTAAFNLSTGTYTITVTDSSGCDANTSLTLTQPYMSGSVCYVTTDSNSKHNVVIWDPSLVSGQGVDSFKIYFYNPSNEWQFLKEVPDTVDYYVDQVNNPNIATVRYNVTSISEECGEEPFANSLWQNTMWIYGNNGTFKWSGTGYLIEGNSDPVLTYILYRDNYSNGHWNAIDSVSGTQNVIADPQYSHYPHARWSLGARLNITSGCIAPPPVIYGHGPVATGNNSTISYSNQLSNASTGTLVINDASLFEVYPNPNNGNFTVAGLTQGEIIEVYNYLGQEIQNKIVDNSTMHFDISTTSNGVYLVRVLNKDRSLVGEKKIVKMQ